MSASEDDVLNPSTGLEDDLFGSDDDDAPAEKPRYLSDEELDSGDDEGRRDRAQSEDAAEEDGNDSRVRRILEASIARHTLPKPIDGQARELLSSRPHPTNWKQFNSLRLPGFLGIDPRPYDPKTFKIPTADHHLQEKSKNFSASLTASSTMRFRKSQATGQLESNTNVYRWSDGSMTIAVGGEHYELQSKPLAPPMDKPYQPLSDSHIYLCSPAIESQLFVVVGHMSSQFSVRPNKGIVDEALEKLQASLAAATRRGKGDEKGGPEIISNTIDPELQKKQAELAEKDRLKAQRRRDQAAEKASLPRGYGGRGTMTVDDLEGGRGRRAPASKPRSKPKRKADYDSDDSAPRGGLRNDEYDREDDFLASSDEEDEPELEDDEEEEEFESERPKAKRAKTSKHQGSDEDAEADLDDDEIMAPAPSEPVGRGRKQRHNVIDDEDDDE